MSVYILYLLLLPLGYSIRELATDPPIQEDQEDEALTYLDFGFSNFYNELLEDDLNITQIEEEDDTLSAIREALSSFSNAMDYPLVNPDGTFNFVGQYFGLDYDVNLTDGTLNFIGQYSELDYDLNLTDLLTYTQDQTQYQKSIPLDYIDFDTDVSEPPVPDRTVAEFVELLQRSTSYTGNSGFTGQRGFDGECFGEKKIQNMEVVGGFMANVTRYPYLVSLQVLSGGIFTHACGGTLLTNKLVLTAAHCVFSGNEMFGFQLDHRADNTKYIGDISKTSGIFATRAPQCRHQAGPGGRIRASRHYIHPDYKGFGVTGSDVAVLELETPFDYDGPFPQIAEQQAEIPAYVLGWGFVNQEEASNPGEFERNVESLRVGPLRVKSTEYCRNNAAFNGILGIEQIISNPVICAFAAHTDACKADSGGPLMQLVSPNNLSDPATDIQLGIVSWGPDSTCSGKEGFPGVYVNIPHYASWIKTIVGLNSIPAPLCTSQLSIRSEVIAETLLVGHWNVQNTLTECCKSCSGLQGCNSWTYCIDREGCQLANGTQIQRGFCELKRQLSASPEFNDTVGVSVWSGYMIEET